MPARYTLLGMDTSSIDTSEDSGSEELYKNPDDNFLPREAAATSDKESEEEEKVPWEKPKNKGASL